VLVIRAQDKPEAAWRPGNIRTVIHVGAALGAKHLTVAEQWFEPGAGAPTHRHPEDVEETIQVFSGRARFWVDGEEAELDPGDSIILPGGSEHGFVALGEEPLHIGGATSSATTPTVYVDEPDAVYDIAGTDGLAVDGTRVVRPVDAT
jgi:quercetin dioxygenase-like cupin family protein